MKASKLRHALRFRWTQSSLGQATEAQIDSVFEAGNVLMNVAFWFMKHAAMISAKEDLKVPPEKPPGPLIIFPFLQKRIKNKTECCTIIPPPPPKIKENNPFINDNVFLS